MSYLLVKLYTPPLMYVQESYFAQFGMFKEALHDRQNFVYFSGLNFSLLNKLSMTTALHLIYTVCTPMVDDGMSKLVRKEVT